MHPAADFLPTTRFDEDELEDAIDCMSALSSSKELRSVLPFNVHCLCSGIHELQGRRNYQFSPPPARMYRGCHANILIIPHFSSHWPEADP